MNYRHLNILFFFLPIFTLAADTPSTWKWTTLSRNGQPLQVVLKLAPGKDGTMTGTLTEPTGTTPVTKVSLTESSLAFTVVRDTPRGPIEIGYSGTIEGDTLQGTFDRYDSALAARNPGQMRKATWTATRAPAPKATPPPADKN